MPDTSIQLQTDIHMGVLKKEKFKLLVFVIKNLPSFPFNLQWKVQNYKDKQHLPATMIMCSCDKEHGCIMSLCVGSR